MAGVRRVLGNEMIFALGRCLKNYYDTAVYTYSLKLNDVNAALLYRSIMGQCRAEYSLFLAACALRQGEAV